MEKQSGLGGSSRIRVYERVEPAKPDVTLKQSGLGGWSDLEKECDVKTCELPETCKIRCEDV